MREGGGGMIILYGCVQIVFGNKSTPTFFFFEKTIMDFSLIRHKASVKDYKLHCIAMNILHPHLWFMQVFCQLC